MVWNCLTQYRHNFFSYPNKLFLYHFILFYFWVSFFIPFLGFSYLFGMKKWMRYEIDWLSTTRVCGGRDVWFTTSSRRDSLWGDVAAQRPPCLKLVAWGMKTWPLGMKYQVRVRNACAWYEMKCTAWNKNSFHKVCNFCIRVWKKFLRYEKKFKGMKKTFRYEIVFEGMKKYLFGMKKNRLLKISHFIP